MPAHNLTSGAAYLIIVCSTSIVWSCLVLYIRVFLRQHINGPFGWDDAACAAATVTGVAESVITLTAEHYGLGFHIRDVTAEDLKRVVILLWLAQMTYILTMGFSMLSIAFLINRISRFPTHLILARVFVALIGVWTLVSTLIVAFQCNLPDPWTFDPPSRCINRWHLWLSITTLQAFLECCNLKAAFILIWKVQMPLKAKTKVFAAFALRLLVLPPTFARLILLHDALPSDDPTHARVKPNLMTQVVMHTGILLATIPCAKPFFVVFERGVFKAPFDHEYSVGQSYNIGSDHPKTPTRVPTAPRSVAISWNYRSTFAKGVSPAPPAITNQKRSPPWAWSRRRTFDSQASVDTPLQIRKVKSSAPSSHSDGRVSGPAYSSNHTRSPNALRGNTARECCSRECDKTRDSSLTSSRVRRQSELEWTGTVRPDAGKTTSTISHDPVGAVEWHDLRPNETASERDVRTAAIETTQTFEVIYSLREEESAPKD